MAQIKSNAASVEFRNVSKFYGKSTVAAVKDVSLFIEAGKLVTLLGPSGCGKTTTLRMIAGLEFATQGQILIGGEDVTRLPATDRDVSMVFQSYALFPHMSVRDNVEYGLKFSGFNKQDTREKAQAGLDLVGLSDYGERLPSQLSGGQQQRVAIARSLAMRPKVLLCDEITSALDPELVSEVLGIVRDLAHQGMTMLLATHEMGFAREVASKVCFLYEGVVHEEGPPAQIFGDPHEERTRAFLKSIIEAGRL